MSIYTVCQGDVFESCLRKTDTGVSPPDRVIIPHVCNNIGAWGKGFTQSVDIFAPHAKYAFEQFCNTHGKESLGCNIKVPISKYSAIIHMIAQDGLRSKQNPQPLNYEALHECMEGVEQIAKVLECSINCPKFGAGLAGGDWAVIEDMIDELWLNEGIDVTVWEYI